MGLGNNRDYKTSGIRVKQNLLLHSILMRQYTSIGWSKETASERALEDLKELTHAEKRKMLGTWLATGQSNTTEQNKGANH